mmetsp:Transcript_60491/g.72727  ORF Transcript_60491/g.72727 Transcript_60491/m.72727 type:complete len:696 (+) Transcript_60491:205-2292(+)
MSAKVESLLFHPSIAASAAATIVFAAGLSYALSVKKRTEHYTGDICAEDSLVVSSEDDSLDPNIYPGGHLSLLYGSQTGTSEAFCNQIQEQEREHGFKIRVIDLEEITCSEDVQSIILDPKYCDPLTKRTKVALVVATYGEGDPTDNALNFYNILKVKLGIHTDEMDGEADTHFFDAVDYMVFGLGNRQYEHFNSVAKFIDSALEKLSATRIAQLGIGDDDNDLEGDFETWKENTFWKTLKSTYLKHGTSLLIEKNKHGNIVKPELPFSVKYHPSLEGRPLIMPDKVERDQILNSSRYYFNSHDCVMNVCRELRTPEDGGSTLHMEFDVSKLEKKYYTADNLAVLPMNNNESVELIAEALEFNLDAVFSLVPSVNASSDKFQHSFPTPCTVRDYLSRYCDLISPPRRSELKKLASYATDPTDRNALTRMSSKEGKKEYADKMVAGHVGIVDIVSELCTSISMSLDEFVALCPRLQPRYYTISSSSSVHPDSIHITVSILSGIRRDSTDFTGVCTGHLASIRPGDKCRVFVRDSSFRLPTDSTKPVIMIGPGTGIAPMRALLQERAHQKIEMGKEVGPNVLYFGCKNSKQDFIYADELEEFQRNGTLNSLYVAFSREQKKKVYVQHLLEQNSSKTWSMIDKLGASIFICGGTKMGHDVVQVLSRIAMEVGGMTEDEAKTYYDQLHTQGRFVQELWS